MTAFGSFSVMNHSKTHSFVRLVQYLVFTLIIGALSASWALADGPFDEGTKAYRNHEYVRAFRVLEPLAVQGNIEAAYLVGSMHELGQGTVQSYTQAEVFLKKAAEGGNSDAQVRLAFLYADGHLGNDRSKDAADWFEKAARLGNPTAQVNLGVIFANGLGRIQNYTLGHMWTNIAVANGHEKAAEMRDKIQMNMDKALIIQAQELARKCMFSNYVECNY